MSIYFLDTEPGDEAFFREALPGGNVRFVRGLAAVREDARIVSLFIRTRVDAAFLDAHPALRLIATRTTGLDHLDLPACHARNVLVANVMSYGENTVAEHTFALILSLARRLHETEAVQRTGQRFSYETLRGFDLKGKTLGVIGAGRIGLHVVRIARAFGMRVLAFDTTTQSFLSEILDYEYAPLEHVLAESHIISLHAPLRPDTRHILNRETLARCRRGVLVVNTARGGLIDTAALLEALESGQVGGAGLDVLEDEETLPAEPTKLISAQIVDKLKALTGPAELQDPAPERVRELQDLMRHKTLLARPDVVYTPHVAFNSVEAVARINSITAENIRAFLRGDLGIRTG